MRCGLIEYNCRHQTLRIHATERDYLSAHLSSEAEGYMQCSLMMESSGRGRAVQVTTVKVTIIPCVVGTSIQCCSRRKGRDEYQSGGSKQGQGTEGEGGTTGMGREGPHRGESWKGRRSFSPLSAIFLFPGLPACRLACTRRPNANVVRHRRRRFTRCRTFTSPSERRFCPGPTGAASALDLGTHGVACFLCNAPALSPLLHRLLWLY